MLRRRNYTIVRTYCIYWPVQYRYRYYRIYIWQYYYDYGVPVYIYIPVCTIYSQYRPVISADTGINIYGQTVSYTGIVYRYRIYDRSYIVYIYRYTGTIVSYDPWDLPADSPACVVYDVRPVRKIYIYIYSCEFAWNHEFWFQMNYMISIIVLHLLDQLVIK